MSEIDFPVSLLEKPALERLEYFRAYTIAHPILKEVHTKLIQTIREPSGTSLIFIYGATGSGKTTLRLKIEKQIRQEFQLASEKNPGHIPIIGIEAAASDSKIFNWKDYYKRILIALEEPLIDYKIKKIVSSSESPLYFDQKIAGTELRYALERALHYRRPAALLIDEAQHIAKVASGRKLQDQMDSLKSLANITGTLHVLIGTYELLEFRNLSAQLSRRSLDLHLRRYLPESKGDIQIFKNIIFLFQQNLPLKQQPDLIKYWDYLYERSIGCIGILKDWLTRSFAIALEENSSSLTLKHLEKQAISLAQCKKMAKEIVEGEEQLIEKEEDRKELRALLGLAGSFDKPESSQKASIEPEHEIKKNRYIGTRKPKRDKIGN